MEGDNFDIACLYALTGDADNAFKHLQLLVDLKKDRSKQALNDSDFKSLHKDRRWLPMIEALK